MVINVDEKCQKLLSEANARLKQAKVKVAIECREESGSLYLRATLPPKPGSVKKSLYQQRIPLRSDQGIGVKITPVGIKYAEQQAKRLSADLVLSQFNWDMWLGDRDKNAEEDSTPSVNLSVQLLSLWDQYAAFKAESLSQTTIGKDFRRIRNHIQDLATQELDNAIAIQDYLQSRVTPNTARRILVQLNACCNWAVKRSLLSLNPFTGMARTIKVVKEDEIDPFTREEMISIIQGFENDPYYAHYTPFVKFLFLTGCRTSEAIGLCWKHIAQDSSFIWFVEAVVEGYRKDTKTKRKRKFPCNESLQSLLDSIHLEKIHPDAPIFPSPKGKLIDSHNFLNRAWTKVLEKQGIRYRCQYQTRHTFITNCIEQGIPIPQIARWVGNSPEVILRHYAGWFDKHEVPVML
jgi:integrase